MTPAAGAPFSRGWNFAEIWEMHAERFPEAPALIHGGQRTSWAELDRRAEGIAATLLDAQPSRQETVAQYLYNSSEYLESMAGIFKAGLVPVNTNYRYLADEVAALWEDADVVAVIFHGTLLARCDEVRRRLPRIRTWIHVDDGGPPCPAWAVPYDEAAHARPVPARWPRSGDDLFLLYTGGTTGSPKGVMWRQDDLAVSVGAGTRRALPAEASRSSLLSAVSRPGPVFVPAAPLMHGAAAAGAIGVLDLAGCVVTLTGRSFDPHELLETVASERVASVTLVGDAFSRPLLDVLEADPATHDLSSLRAVISTGAAWSSPVKERLGRCLPGVLLVDVFGSSEAVSAARALSSGGNGPVAFAISATTRVLDERGRDVEPGSGQVGRIAVRGRTPLGYYKDRARSEATFVEIDGERHVIPGDFASVEADGTLRLLGRGANCVNTGGEKVFPEEVEGILRAHPAVADVAVVGVPDPRLGEALAALVEVAGEPPGAAELVAFVKGRLAGFKAPRHVVFGLVPRAANGKLDYPGVRSAVASGIARG